MDSRLATYHSAVQAIAAGDFRVETAAGADDEIGRLGVAIQQMAQELERRFTELNGLIELSNRVSAAILLEEVLDHVFEAFRGIIPFDRLGLALLEPDGVTARAVWSRSIHGDLGLGVGYAADIRHGSLRQLLETGAPRVLNDLEEYLAHHPESASTRLMLEAKIRASLTCPLMVTGRAVGFLFFSSSTPHCYADAHVALYQRISVQLAWVVEKSRLYQELLRARDELAEANRRLERLAAVDGLTEIPNRRTLDTALEREWQRGLRTGGPLAFVIFDVDDFKAYNDTYGHLLGDDVLRMVARTLRRSFRRAGDFVARFGGEEFAALLPGTDAVGALQAAQRARAAVEATGIPHLRARAARYVTVSGGVAVVTPRRAMPVDTLLAAADAALYRAKAAGRNTVFLHDIEERPTTRPPDRSRPVTDS